MRMGKDLTLFQLFAQENRVIDIPSIVDTYLTDASELRISGLFLISGRDIFELIKKTKLYEYEIQKKAESSEVLSFELTRHIEKSGRKISGKILVMRSNQPNVYFTLSNGDLEFITLGMKRYFEELFPVVAIMKLSSRHLQSVLNNLEKKSGFTIIADRTVANKRIYRHKKESSVTYTDKPFREVFERASEEDQWIDKIDFRAINEDESKIVLTAFLSRSSIYRISNNFSLFHKIVISDICNISQAIFSLYANRSRRQLNEVRSAKPLVIDFGYTIFDQPKKNKQLIEAIKELTNSSVSVIHGNPYIHASIVDFLDGSSYDLWVLSQDRLILVPQMRATYSSINRICDHIFRRFREGEIKDYEVAVNDS